MKLHKFIEVKGHNRRIAVFWYVSEADSNEHAIVVQTKRLLDFKKRHITSTSNLYSIESFLILADCMDAMRNSPEFKKATNRIIGQMDKNRPQARTNLTVE